MGASGKIGKQIASALEAVWGSGKIGEIFLQGRNTEKLDAAHREILSSTFLTFLRRPSEMAELKPPVIRTNFIPDNDRADIIFVTTSANFVLQKDDVSDHRNKILEGNARIFEQSVIPLIKDIIDSGQSHPYIINVSNPVDSLTTYLYKRLGEVCKKPVEASRFCASAGFLDSYRAKYITAERLGLQKAGEWEYNRVDATAIGEHGDAMVIPASALLVDGKPISENLEYFKHYPDIVSAASIEGIRIMQQAGSSPSIAPAQEMITVAKHFADSKNKEIISMPLPVHGFNPRHGVFIGAMFEFGSDGLHLCQTQPELTFSEKEKYSMAVRKIQNQVVQMYQTNGLGSKLARGIS